MYKKLILPLILFVLVAFTSNAQKVDPYAFSGSLSSGYMRVEEFNTNATVGLTGTYHRQFTSAFSLRTALEIQYLVPNRLFQFDGSRTVVSSEEYLSSSLLFGPDFHFRDEGYRMHLGVLIGIGYGYEGYRGNSSGNEEDLGTRSWESFTMVQSQLNAGILFPLKNKDAEMGFDISYLVNLDFPDIDRDVFQNGYRVSFVYHYNLSK